MAILTCPGCGRTGLRVPDGRRGKVTCPTCQAEWFHPATVEVSEVEFRCAQSGAKFAVQMSRRSPLHNFVVQGIKGAPARAPKMAATEPKSPDGGTIHLPERSAPHLPLAKSRNWLEKLFGKTTGAPDSCSSAADTSDPIVHLTARAAQHDATEYNWTSFFAPTVTHRASSNALADI